MEILTKEDWENYKKQVEQSLKVNTMAVMTDKQLLRFINQKLELCRTETTLKDETKNTESVKSVEKMVA